MARAQGGWVEAIAATVNKQSVLDAIAKSIENTRLATEVASTGIGRMAEGIIHLGSVGSQYLPRLAEWFNKIADKFANWAEAGASNGSIESAIERAIDAAKKLWDIIMSLVGIMKSFAKAAEDAGFTLDYAVERTRAIENALKSLEGRQILTDLFSGALQGMENFRAQLEGLGPLMVRISNTIRQAMEIAGEVIGRVAATLAVAFSTEGATKGVIDFFNGILSAVKSLQAVAPQMGEIFGAITSFAGTLAHIVGEVLATAIRELGPSLVKLLDALKPVVEIIGTALVQAIQTVSPWLTKIIDWIAAMDPAVLAAVVVGIGGVAAAFKGMSIVSEIVTALEGIAAVLGGSPDGSLLLSSPSPPSRPGSFTCGTPAKDSGTPWSGSASGSPASSRCSSTGGTASSSPPGTTYGRTSRCTGSRSANRSSTGSCSSGTGLRRTGTVSGPASVMRGTPSGASWGTSCPSG